MAMKTFLIPLGTSVPNPTVSALRAYLSNADPMPLHITNLVTSWPALKAWTLSDGLERLKEIVGEDRLIEIELVKRARGYLDPNFKKVQTSFGIYPVHPFPLL